MAPAATKTSPDASAALAGGPLLHNIDAERALLGALLRNNSAIGDVLQIVGRDDFYRDQHRVLFDVVLNLYNERKPVDLTILNDEMARRGVAEKAGGSQYLVELCEAVPVPGNAEHYAEIVRERALVRQLIQTCQTVIQEAVAGGQPAAAQLDRAEKMIFECANRKVLSRAATVFDLLKEVFQSIPDIHDRKARTTGLPTGFFELDDMITGLQPSQLVVIAGRPSMGKSTLALNIAEHIGLNEKKPVLFFSLEMGRLSAAQNMLCSHTRVSGHRLRQGKVTEEEFQRLLVAAGAFEDAPIFIDDSTGLSALDLRARARRLKRDHDIQLVIVDYLQLMEIREQRPENRQQEIAMISRSLKALARELDVAVIALSQLNRAVETRDDHRPRLADLRESGAIEQDADCVLTLYRDDMYNRENSPEPNTCEVNIAKQRNGPAGQTIKLAFLKDYMRFENLAVRAASEAPPL